MHDQLNGGDQQEETAPASSPLRVIWRGVFLGLVAFGVFYLMLAVGAARFIHGCNTVLCGQLHQTVFAAVGALAVLVAAYRIFTGQPSAAKITFFGTVPILIVHIVLVITDPNESMFFPLSTTPPPAISGALLLYRAVRRPGVPAKEHRRP